MAYAQAELRELFCEVLECASAEQRAEFLSRSCQGRPELRDRIEQLLRAHDEGSDFLQEAAKPAVPLGESEGECPGTLLGDYKLAEQIGEGGFGLVFAADQQQPVRRRVAVKIIRPGMDTRDVIARFEAERQALALMDHPNIAKVLDAGETASGRPYFVMELFRGVPITDYCDQHGLTARRRLELFGQVCQAVQHAHQKGIIHRDLKPSNVLVLLDEGDAAVKVIDFGIAKALGQHLTDKTLVTGAAQMVGTPLYMSPEQAEMSLDIDTRSDIYSLGVLLYELLTGTTPFEKERLDQAGYDEMRRIFRQEEPPAPSTRIDTLGPAAATVSAQRQSDPRRLSQLLRGELDWIVMKALEKDRGRRYETASAFAADIKRFLHDEPVTACPPSVWYRCRKFARRHQAAVRATLATLLLVLLASGALGWALWDRAEQEATHRAEQAQRLADTERTVSIALIKAEQARDQAAGKPSATSQQAEAVLLVWRQAEAGVAQAEAALSTGTADDALRRRVLDLQRRITQGRHRDEQRLAQVLRKEKLLRDLDDARMALATWTGSHFDHAGASARYAAALAAYGLEVKPGKTAELAQRIRAEESAVREALVVALDYWSYNAVGAKTAALATQLTEIASAADDDAWRQRLRQAMAGGNLPILRAMSGEARRLSLPPSTLLMLGDHLYYLGERAEAVALLRWARLRHHADFWIPYTLGAFLGDNDSVAAVELEEAIGCYQAALAVRPTATAAHNNLGRALYAKKQFDDALAAYRQALALDPQFTHAHYNVALTLRALNRVDEAIEAYRQAIKVDPQNAELFNNLGAVLKDKGLVDEAIEAWRQAVKLDPKLPQAHFNLGNAHQAKNQVDEAIEAYRLAIKYDPHYAAAHNNLGRVLFRKKYMDEAIAEFRKAIEINPEDAVAHYNLGNALAAKNQLNPAIAEFRKAIDLDPKHAFAHYNLGNALQAKKQWDEAIAAYRKAIDLDPKYAPAHYNLGTALHAKNQWDEAIAAYRKAIDLDSKYVFAHYNLGNALQAKHEWDEAIAAYRKAIDLDPKYALAHCNLGTALQAKSQWDEAIAAYRKAIDLDPKYALAHYNLGTALQAKHQWDEAIAAYREAIDLNPRNAMAHCNLGAVLRIKGRLDEAIAAYREAVRCAPELVNAWVDLGYVLAGKDLLDEAMEAYQQALKIDSKYVSAHYNLGTAYLKKGQFANARTHTRQALDLAGERHALRPMALRQLKQCERLLPLEQQLPDLLAGKAAPADNRQRLDLIEVCQLQRRHATAVRLCGEAFAEDAELAKDLQAGHRYRAAACATLAGAGKGTDVGQLDEQERTKLRNQALDWLRADLKLWGKRLEAGQAEDRRAVREKLQQWLSTPDLSDVRDARALGKLPAAEQQPWQELWAEVARRLKQASDAN
jgi:tetratricopeptide (TPR) repeat protein/serine/threonine protein kinase